MSDVSHLSPARALAAHVLVRVWRDGAFAAAALDAELRRNPTLDGRDAGLATELVYGVLRTEASLASRIDAYTRHGGWSTDPEIRAHVLMGAYALSYLDKVPAFAAVSEAVTGASQAKGQKVGGFVNALLRKVASGPAAPPIEEAIVAAAPGWLRGGLRRSIGRAGAAAYLAAGPVPPPIGLVVADAAARDAWIPRLREAAGDGASIEPGAHCPHAILVRGAGDVRRLPGAGADWIVQEEGAQIVGLSLGARPGDAVLDACAGRGNKAFLLGVGVRSGAEGGGAVDVADLHPAKLEALMQTPFARAVRASYAVDWSRGVGAVPEGYDRVLVDAPCSGTGTLRRRPEIAGKREPEDVTRLAELQVAIARHAATRVKVGGALVFAVCSVLAEEAERVVERLLVVEDGGAELVAAPLAGPAAGIADGASSLRLLPHVHGTDGYFMAAFTRVR